MYIRNRHIIFKQARAYLGPCQTSMMKRFAEIVNGLLVI